MARLSPPADWQALETDDDWKAHRGGVIVLHQRTPITPPTQTPFPTSYHARNCRWVWNAFRERVARGADNSQWFRAPDAGCAEGGGAVACNHCLGE
jgi:hypothetical protein